VVERVARNAALACAVMAAAAALWTRDPAMPLGVLGGGVLIGLSYWAIKGSVDALVARRSGGETPGKAARWPLVKFFTRHGMLALAAYGMMVRLRLDPVGLLAGVSSLGAAVAIEALRDLRWRRFP
jgi:hypothetical protein